MEQQASNQDAMALQAIEERPIATQAEAEQLIERASVIAVTNPVELASAGDLAKSIGRLLKQREADRLSWTKPLKDIARRIELRFKPGDEALESAKRMVIGKQDFYSRKVEAERAAEAKRLQDIADAKARAEAQEAERVAGELRERQRAAEEAAAKAAAEGRAAEAAKQAADAALLAEQSQSATQHAEEVLAQAAAAPVIQPQPVSLVRGAEAVSSQRTTWHAEILDFKELPEHVIAHPKVKEAAQAVVDALVRSGTRELSGVRIYSQKTTINR